MQKLEEWEDAGARSVAVELESLVDGEQTLVDHVGRGRILRLCREIQETCQKVSAADMRKKLERELSDAVLGKSRWHLPGVAVEPSPAGEQTATDGTRPAAGSGGGMPNGEAAACQAPDVQMEVPHLAVARGKKPLSLWDWKIWTMARPRLWRYGDGGNLYEREVPLSTAEWVACLLRREAGRRRGCVMEASWT